MSKNSRSPRKFVTAIFKQVKAILIFLGITGGILTGGILTGGILLLPEQLNRFFDEYPVLRERWLNATHWTGMYSSFPEGVVNMAELDLSWESDVTIITELLRRNAIALTGIFIPIHSVKWVSFIVMCY